MLAKGQSRSVVGVLRADRQHDAALAKHRSRVIWTDKCASPVASPEPSCNAVQRRHRRSPRPTTYCQGQPRDTFGPCPAWQPAVERRAQRKSACRTGRS